MAPMYIVKYAYRLCLNLTIHEDYSQKLVAITWLPPYQNYLAETWVVFLAKLTVICVAEPLKMRHTPLSGVSTLH